MRREEREATLAELESQKRELQLTSPQLSEALSALEERMEELVTAQDQQAQLEEELTTAKEQAAQLTKGQQELIGKVGQRAEQESHFRVLSTISFLFLSFFLLLSLLFLSPFFLPSSSPLSSFLPSPCLQLREVGIKHRNRCNASLKVIDQNKQEIAELKERVQGTTKDSFGKAQGALRAARTRIQTITSDKDQVRRRG